MGAPEVKPLLSDEPLFSGWQPAASCASMPSLEPDRRAGGGPTANRHQVLARAFGTPKARQEAGQGDFRRSSLSNKTHPLQASIQTPAARKSTPTRPTELQGARGSMTTRLP